MQGLIMDYQLTLPAILRRAELFRSAEVVSRLPDRGLHRYTYGEFVDRTRRLAAALQQLGVKPGDRVATFCWNHRQHLECPDALGHTPIGQRAHAQSVAQSLAY